MTSCGLNGGPLKGRGTYEARIPVTPSMGWKKAESRQKTGDGVKEELAMKREKLVKRMSVILLAGMLTAFMAPTGARAAETQEAFENVEEAAGTQTNVEEETVRDTESEENAGDGEEQNESRPDGGAEGETGTEPDDSTEGEAGTEPDGSTEAGTEPGTGTGSETGSSDEPAGTEETQPVVFTDTQTGITVQGDAASLPAMGMLYVTKVDSGEALELLDQYFSLIADQFAVFDIRILSLPDMSLAEPGAAVQISIPLPDGYDPERTAVYYTDGTGMPAEMSAQAAEGNLVFETDHVGTFIIAEKKDNSGMQTDLPSYLEPTQKTEKLQLQKTDLPGRVSLTGSYGASGEYTSPQTGDNANFVVWIAVLVAAVAAVVVVIVLKRRK